MSNEKKMYNGAYQEIIDLGGHSIATDFPCMAVNSSGCEEYCSCHAEYECVNYGDSPSSGCNPDEWGYVPWPCEYVDSCGGFECGSFTYDDSGYNCG